MSIGRLHWPAYLRSINHRERRGLQSKIVLRLDRLHHHAAMRLVRAVFATGVLVLVLSACVWQSSTVRSPTPAGETAVTERPQMNGPTTAADGQPAFPIRAAFYYQWFPQGWQQNGTFPYSVYTPSLGWYDSGSAETIRSHIEAMRFGHITAAIASWWGQDEKDEQVPMPRS